MTENELRDSVYIRQQMGMQEECERAHRAWLKLSCAEPRKGNRQTLPVVEERRDAKIVKAKARWETATVRLAELERAMRG